MTELTPLGRRQRSQDADGPLHSRLRALHEGLGQRLGRATSGSWLGLLLLWIVHVRGLFPVVFLGRLGLATCLLLTSWWLCARLRRLAPEHRALALAALGLLLLGLVVRLNGVTHELVEQAYLDEGTYLHHAAEIHQGQWRRGSFVYPHLLYNAGAFGFWLADLAEPLSSWASNALLPPWERGAVLLTVRAELVEGQTVTPADPDANFVRNRLVMRLIVALLSAMATLPVAFFGLRLGGPLVGLLAGMFWILSPLVNEGSHLVISDWPAACFAAWCLALVAQWYERPGHGVAVLCGAFAGLAAAAKYPGGLVAIAIVGVWLSHQKPARATPVADGSIVFGLRRIEDLALSTLAALATFLAASPSFFVSPQHALFAPRGMLFGLHQYAGGGWLGVQPDSNAWFYVRQMAASFGWPTLAAAAIGWSLLLLRPSSTRHRLLWLAPFPVLYLVLLSTMSMVVKRNLAPAMPALCALVGLGVFVVMARTMALSQRLTIFRTRAARSALVLISAALFLGPAAAESTRQGLALARASTRDLATLRIASALPPGVRLLKESYTPRLRNLPMLHIEQARFLARRPLEALQSGNYDYLLSASSAYLRFLRDDAELEGHHVEMAATYRKLFAELPVVWRLEPGSWRNGPDLRLLAVSSAVQPTGLRGAQLGVTATLPDSTMQHTAGIEYTRPGQWALLRLQLLQGANELTLRGRFRVPSSAQAEKPQLRWMLLRSPASLEAASRIELSGDSTAMLTAPIESPASEPALVYVFLPQGSLLEQVEVRARTDQRGRM